MESCVCGEIFVPHCLLPWERDEEQVCGSSASPAVCTIPTRVSAPCAPVLYQVPPLDFPGVQAISPLLLPSTSMIIWAQMHTEDYKAVLYGPATEVPIIC